MKSGLKNLEEVLSAILSSDEARFLAPILFHVLEKEKISYKEAKQIAKQDIEDILLTAVEWKLLVPISSFKQTLSWEDNILVFKEDEVYKMPNITRCLVQEAIKGKKWDIRKAVAEVFRMMGENEWEKMPDLVEGLKRESKGRNINAFQIKKICREIGLDSRTDSITAELKGAGIISPHLSSIPEIIKQGQSSPLYEINPLMLIDLFK